MYRLLCSIVELDKWVPCPAQVHREANSRKGTADKVGHLLATCWTLNPLHEGPKSEVNKLTAAYSVERDPSRAQTPKMEDIEWAF